MKTVPRYFQKTFRKVGIVLLGVLVLVAVVKTQAQNTLPNTTTSNSTVDASTLAEFEQARKAFKGFRVESAAEFIKMKQYREQLLAEGKITHTFTLANGHLCHCIETASQPAVKQAGIDPHTIQPEPEILPGHSLAESKKIRDDLSARFGMDGSLDNAGNVRRCPIGSIPVLIPSLEDLCRFEKLEDQFNKYPKIRRHPSGPASENGHGHMGAHTLPEPNPSAPHEYARASQIVANQGGQAVFNFWQPFVEQSDEFSLAQLWITAGNRGNAAFQSVEAGWQVCEDIYGDSNPHLFVFFTTNDYAEESPPNTFGGAYNRTGNYFMQTSSSVLVGGVQSPASAFGGQPQTLTVGFSASNQSHNWVLTVNGMQIGYYPNSYFNGVGLASASDTVAFGGEIVNDHIGGVHTTTEMGSGQFPSGGSGYSAYIRNIQYFDLNGVMQSPNNLSTTATAPVYYNLTPVGTDPTGGSYFYFGGGPYYCVTDLGVLPSMNGSTATGINNKGQIVGNSFTDDESVIHPFLYASGTITDLGTLGGALSFAVGINNSDQVAGYSQNAAGKLQAFIYNGEGLIPIGTLDSVAYAINKNGQIAGVGGNTNDSPEAFLYSDGTMTGLGTLPGGVYSEAYGINDVGEIVGGSSGTILGIPPPNNYYHAFLYSSGIMSDLGTLGGTYSVANDINNNGQIVGMSYLSDNATDDAFLYSGGTMSDLGTFTASGINNSGQIVGSSGSSAILYSAGIMTVLDNLISPTSGWALQGAAAINDNVQIVGIGTNPSGQNHAFMLFKAAASPNLGIATQVDGTLIFSWNGQIGQKWQLQYTSNLSQTGWINVGSTILATGSIVTASAAIGTDSERFYRVVLVPSS